MGFPSAHGKVKACLRYSRAHVALAEYRQTGRVNRDGLEISQSCKLFDCACASTGTPSAKSITPSAIPITFFFMSFFRVSSPLLLFLSLFDSQFPLRLSKN